MNLEPLARRVAIGVAITLTLRNGDILTGAVVEWGRDYVIVDGAEGEQYLVNDVIIGINVPRVTVANSSATPSAPVLSVESGAVAVTSPEPITPASSSEASDAGTPSAVSPPTAASPPSVAPADWWTRIKQEYDAAVTGATIKRLPVEIKSAKDALLSLADQHQIGMELRIIDQIRNKYQYGVKVKEANRFIECAQMVRTLQHLHPQVPEFALLRSALLAEAGQFAEALFALDDHQQSAEVLYQRAVLAMDLQRPVWALDYLEQLFIMSMPAAVSSAWFFFIQLALRGREFSRITNVVEAASSTNPQAADVVCDGVLYVLSIMVGSDTPLYAEGTRPGLDDVLRAMSTIAPPTGTKVTLPAFGPTVDTLPAEEPASDAEPVPTPSAVLRNSAVRQSAIAPASAKPAGVKKAVGLYANARRAEDERRLEEAEKLYRRAIEAADNREKAVKSLAWLMQRLRRGQEAIELIEKYRQYYRESDSYENVRIALFQHTGHHSEAAKALGEAIERASEQRRPVLMRQMAYSLIRAGLHAEAEQALRELIELDPTDPTARTWLTTVTKALERDDLTLLDAIIANKLTAAQEAGVSDLLVFYLESCAYAGVDARRVASRNFRDADIDELRTKTAAEKRKPGDRARYNLSGAKILLDMNRGDDPQVRDFLQFFCAGMADAAVLEQQHHDVARNFHLEAFQTADRWVYSLDQLLEQFVRSYSDDADTILRARGHNISNALAAVADQPTVAHAAFLGLLQLAVSSRAAAQKIIKVTFATEDDTRDRWQRLCIEYNGIVDESRGKSDDPDYHALLWTRAIDRARARQRELTNGLFLLLGSLDLRLLGEHVRRIEHLPTEDCNELDRSRITLVRNILERAAEYADQSDYREQERLSSLLDRDIDVFVDEIEREPTKLSFEWLRRYVRDLSGLVLDDFARRQASAEPSELNVALLTESCGLDAEGLLNVQVQIALPAFKSPASAVTLTIQPQPAEYICDNSTILVTQSLNPDRPTYCSVMLRPTHEAITNQVFTLRYSLTFTTRGAHLVQTAIETLSIALYESTDFKPIENPYVAGGPVASKEMFFGREDLIKKLVDSAIRGDYRTVVIWGQMRTGKSTVLLQLKRKLLEVQRDGTGPLRVLPLFFSLLDTIVELTFPNFLHKIVKSIVEGLDELAREGWPRLELGVLPVIDNQATAQAEFHECMVRIRQAMDDDPAYAGAHIVLLIDEFTHLYKQIRGNRVPDTFMQAWKGMYEKRYFSSVIVGTDVMPEFISQYKNEFQVSQRNKVNYLAFEDAKKLIEEPVPLADGESRFRGAAIQQIFDLTAGNPYYIQFFCEHLVDHINEKQALLVGPGDIEEVASSLIENAEFNDDNVDNLIAPSSLMDNAPTAELTLQVLLACVGGTPVAPWFDVETAAAQSIPETAVVLSDLAKREVIQQLQGTRFQVRVGLFARWLVHQANLGRRSA